MAIRVFISHAAKDEKLASALVEFLLSNLVLADEDIRCTSVPGHKLPVGNESSATLRDDLGESAVILGLITGNALNSGWVLFELGAAWGAMKHLKPIVADDVSFTDLPGPLTGHHAAKLSSRADLSQLMEEIAPILGAKRRAAAKLSAALDALSVAHAEHMKAFDAAPAKVRVAAKAKEPSFSGVPFTELKSIMEREMVGIPEQFRGETALNEVSLFTLFFASSRALSAGVNSNYDSGTAAAFLYNEVGLRLLPYGLVQFEKLPAAQARRYKRLIISPEGNKLILHWNRLTSAVNGGK